MATLTKKDATVIFVIVAIIVIIAVIYYLTKDKGCDPNRNGYDKSGNLTAKCKVEDPTSTNTQPPAGTSGWISDAYFPIKRGSWGPRVSALQKAIGADADGKFGPLTEAKLIEKTGKSQITTQAEYDAIVGSTSAVSTKKTIDDYIGSYLKDNKIDVVVRYIDDGSEFKTYPKNSNIGRLGSNLGGGYHRIFDVAGDTSIRGLKIADAYVRSILGL